ncbi:MAG: hypothetical protein M1825_005701 [Sarcosagium campestre]|nr:MAG: hypothetical protein M1825_005701 [Sarcosagium campestre]
MATFSKDNFSYKSYAAFRPTYPTVLYLRLITFHFGPRKLCLDLGCGPGITSRALTSYFESVIGVDPSPGMIEQAQASTNPTSPKRPVFQEASAESLPFIKSGSVDAITAGQAAHWFDFPRLWPEMARIVREGGTLAFWGYKDAVFVDYPRATAILDRYAYEEDGDFLGKHWSQPGRSIVQNLYRDIKPPDADWEDTRRVEYEPGTEGPRTGEGEMLMQRNIRLGQCMDYIRTWSAYHTWSEAHPGVKPVSQGGEGDVVDRMFEEMVEAESDWKAADRWQDLEVNFEWGTILLFARRRMNYKWTD